MKANKVWKKDARCATSNQPAGNVLSNKFIFGMAIIGSLASYSSALIAAAIDDMPAAIAGDTISDVYPTESDFAVYDQAVFQAASKELNVVFLGMDQLKSKLPSRILSEETVDEKNGGQIVVVERDKVDLDLLQRLLAVGNVVISLGSEGSDNARAALAILTDLEAGHPKMAASEYLQNSVGGYAGVTEDKAGRPIVVKSLVTAHSYGIEGTRSFSTSEQNVTLALAEAINWASEVKAADAANRMSTEKAGSWVWRHTDQHSLSCNYWDGSLGRWKVYGNASISVVFTQALGDGSSSKDYYAVAYTTQTVPSIAYISPQAQELWFNDGHLTSVDFPHSFHRFLDYGPGTTIDGDSVTVGLDSSGLNYSYSYSRPDVSIRDNSSFSAKQLRWDHDINQNSPIGRTTATFRPGALIEGPQSGITPHNPFVRKERYTFQWIRWRGGLLQRWHRANCEIVRY